MLSFVCQQFLFVLGACRAGRILGQQCIEAKSLDFSWKGRFALFDVQFMKAIFIVRIPNSFPAQFFLQDGDLWRCPDTLSSLIDATVTLTVNLVQLVPNWPHLADAADIVLLRLVIFNAFLPEFILKLDGLPFLWTDIPCRQLG